MKLGGNWKAAAKRKSERTFPPVRPSVRFSRMRHELPKVFFFLFLFFFLGLLVSLTFSCFCVPRLKNGGGGEQQQQQQHRT